MTSTDGRTRGLMFLRFPARLSHYGGHGPCCLVSSSRPLNRACGSPAHGLPTPFTTGIRSFPPGLARPGCDNGSYQADQSALVRRTVGDHGQPKVPPALMPLPDEQHQPLPRVVTDLVETDGRMPIPKEGAPTAQEPVHVLDHRFNRQQQPGPGSEFPKPVPGSLHHLVAGPTGEKRDALTSPNTPGPHQPVVKTQKLETWATHLQPHDPGLGLLQLQTEIGQYLAKPHQRGLGLLPGTTHHRRVVGTPHQDPVLPHIPHPIKPVQVNVTEQRGQRTPL